jgi:hypothetical protein
VYDGEGGSRWQRRFSPGAPVSSYITLQIVNVQVDARSIQFLTRIRISLLWRLPSVDGKYYYLPLLVCTNLPLVKRDPNTWSLWSWSRVMVWSHKINQACRESTQINGCAFGLTRNISFQIQLTKIRWMPLHRNTLDISAQMTCVYFSIGIWFLYGTDRPTSSNSRSWYSCVYSIRNVISWTYKYISILPPFQHVLVTYVSWVVFLRTGKSLTSFFGISFALFDRERPVV